MAGANVCFRVGHSLFVRDTPPPLTTARDE